MQKQSNRSMFGLSAALGVVAMFAAMGISGARADDDTHARMTDETPVSTQALADSQSSAAYANAPADPAASTSKSKHKAEKPTTHAVASVAAPPATPASADAQASVSATPIAPPKGKRKAERATSPDANKYFVEFRSRYALSYGHTFLVYGKLNAKGEVAELSPRTVAGLHPIGEGPEMWSVGHVVFVPSETGPSDGDLEEEYVSNRYRIILSEADYQKVAAYIRWKQKHSPLWHAALYNCNRWVGEVAEFMGMKAPFNHVQYPANYIEALKEVNGAVHEVTLPASVAASFASAPANNTAQQ